MHQVELAIAQLQKRVSNGKLLARFPDRVATLLSTSLMDFNKRAGQSSALIREKTEKARSIRDSIVTGANKLFEQQLVVVELQQLQKVKFALEKLYQSTAGDEISKAKFQQLVRKALFDFKIACNNLEDESIGLKLSNQRIQDFNAKVDLLVKDFPESPEAKLIELKNMENKLNDKPASKNGKTFSEIFGVGLSIVGMLRPHGYGNLQGFLTYATSLVGFPVDFMLGVQNDGDSLEVRVEPTQLL